MWMIDGNGILQMGFLRCKIIIKIVGEFIKLKKNIVLYRIIFYLCIFKNFISIDICYSIGNINQFNDYLDKN